MNLIIFILIAISIAHPQCQYQYNEYCCSEMCTNCGLCTGDVIMDMLCCPYDDSVIYCNDDITNVPCVLVNSFQLRNGTDIPPFDQPITPTPQNNKPTDIDVIIAWAKTLEIYQLALFLIGIFIVLMFFVYSCCCFGKKKPPLDYKYISGTIN